MGVVGLRKIPETMRVAASGVRRASSTGLLRPSHPQVALRMSKDLRKWGTSPAIGYRLVRPSSPMSSPSSMSMTHCTQVTFSEIEHRCDALARDWSTVASGAPTPSRSSPGTHARWRRSSSPCRGSAPTWSISTLAPAPIRSPGAAQRESRPRRARHRVRPPVPARNPLPGYR